MLSGTFAAVAAQWSHQLVGMVQLTILAVHCLTLLAAMTNSNCTRGNCMCIVLGTNHIITPRMGQCESPDAGSTYLHGNTGNTNNRTIPATSHHRGMEKCAATTPAPNLRILSRVSLRDESSHALPVGLPATSVGSRLLVIPLAVETKVFNFVDDDHVDPCRTGPMSCHHCCHDGTPASHATLRGSFAC